MSQLKPTPRFEQFMMGIRQPAIKNKFKFRILDCNEPELLVNQCLSYKIYTTQGKLYPEQFIEAIYEVDEAFDVIREINALSRNSISHHIEIYSMSCSSDAFKGKLDFIAKLHYMETVQDYASANKTMKMLVRWKVDTIL